MMSRFRQCAVYVAFAGMFYLPVARAQYTASFQTNIIDGVTSNWSGVYNIGNTTFADVLLIQNGGVLSSAYGVLGNTISSSNNSALITGPGSLWSNTTFFGLYVGSSGAGNVLVISNQAQIKSATGIIGEQTSSAGNRVVVTGTDSMWANLGYLTVGNHGPSNSLVICGGGKANNDSGQIGYSSAGNTVLVTDPGSLWQNNGSLAVGYSTGNTLVISNGAQVTVEWGAAVGRSALSNRVELLGGTFQSLRGLFVGSIYPDPFATPGTNNTFRLAGGSAATTNMFVACNNSVVVGGGSLLVTNAAGSAQFLVNGTLILDAGTVNVDRFVMTNSCAQFTRTGGTLIYGTAVLTTNLDADGDGMANGWEQAYGLDPLNAADANADNDGDGFTNLQEFQAGTDPTNSASAFRILSVVATNDDMLVSWTAGGGRTNVVQSAPDLTGSYTNISPNIVITGTVETTTNYLDAGGATNAVNRYYRIRLVP